jgi:uncharacterized protein
MISLSKQILLALSFMVYSLTFGQASEEKGIPQQPNPPRLVNDFANLLSVENGKALEDKLVAFDDSTSIQISIVIVESIGDYSIEDFALRLGRKWGIGQKGKNNGILITIAKEERKMDIEVGYGLESYITDYDSKHIIDELMIPAFKQSNYYAGLNDASDRIIGLLQGTYKAEKHHRNQEQIPTWAIILLILILILVFSAKSGPGNHYRGGGGGWIITGGGSSWGGSSSSGGFGGFGGGSFGGGGSSGSW